MNNDVLPILLRSGVRARARKASCTNHAPRYDGTHGADAPRYVCLNCGWIGVFSSKL